MKNITHFGLTFKAKLVNLGVGADNETAANQLADRYIEANPDENLAGILNINDLYSIKAQINDALVNLDNEALSKEVVE